MPESKALAKLRRMPAADSDFDVYCGLDWGESVNAYCIVDRGGALLAQGLVPDTPEGLDEILDALDTHGGGQPVAIGIETDQGLLVQALNRTQHAIHAINPRRIKAFREVKPGAKNKNDKADAKLIAYFVRTELYDLRPLPKTVDTVRGLRQMGRAQQDTAQQLVRVSNRLRSTLRMYFPALLVAFSDKHLRSLALCEFLLTASTPAQARRLSVGAIEEILKEVPNTRGHRKRAEEIHRAVQARQLEADPESTRAFAATARALALQMEGLLYAVKDIEKNLDIEMELNPVGQIAQDVVGMGALLAARVFGEIGNLDRYVDVRHLRGYAGTAPDARSSGTSQNSVTHRQACNRRLKNAMFQLANAAYLHSAGAHAYVEAQKAAGKKHNAAIRKASNKMIGALAHCLRTGEMWSEETLWGTAERMINPAHRARYAAEAAAAAAEEGLLDETLAHDLASLPSPRPELNPV